MQFVGGVAREIALPEGYGKLNPALQVKEADRKSGLDALSQLDTAITDATPFIGPGEGRVSTVEQMIGNPDPKLQAMGTKMLLTKMKIDAAIGGARAAASPQILARWDSLLTQKLTPEALHATVQAIREIIGGTGAATGKRIVYDMNGNPVSQ